LENTVDPMWDESFFLPIPVKEQHTCQLALRVVDSDGVGSSGEFLGQHIHAPEVLMLLHDKKVLLHSGFQFSGSKSSRQLTRTTLLFFPQPIHRYLERSRTAVLETQNDGKKPPRLLARTKRTLFLTRCSY
jgi:hypothetical protein